MRLEALGFNQRIELEIEDAKHRREISDVK